VDHAISNQNRRAARIQELTRDHSRDLPVQMTAVLVKMMERKVTDLKVQKRNPNRVNVYLDGEFAFGLARIVAAWLRVGQLIDDEKINSLQVQDAQEKAFQNALRFLSFRPRSETEVQRRLHEQGFGDVEIQTVVDRLKAGGLLGDTEFAKTWVDNRSTFRPRSRKLLKLELRQKGVAEEAIETALAETATEEDLAYQAGQRRARRWAGLDWGEFRERLGAYLMRRGFPYGITAPVTRRIWEEMQSTLGQDHTLGNEED
jgi:regulatory protein